MFPAHLTALLDRGLNLNEWPSCEKRRDEIDAAWDGLQIGSEDGLGEPNEQSDVDEDVYRWEGRQNECQVLR